MTTYTHVRFDKMASCYDVHSGGENSTWFGDLRENGDGFWMFETSSYPISLAELTEIQPCKSYRTRINTKTEMTQNTLDVIWPIALSLFAGGVVNFMWVLACFPSGNSRWMFNHIHYGYFIGFAVAVAFYFVLRGHFAIN